MSNTKILLVDDSATVIALEKLVLRDQPVDIVTATNGRQALEVAKRERPQLILLDIVMPELDGIETCRMLKKSEDTRQIPVIMVTTKGMQHMVAAAYDAGCDDFVTKPVDKVELIQKIRIHALRTEAAQ